MGSSTPSTQNVVQSTQIPQYQQDYAIENENIARDIGTRPFPQYPEQRLAPLTDLQNAGIVQKATIGQNPSYGNFTQDAASVGQGLLRAGYSGAPASYTATNPGAGAGRFGSFAQYNPSAGGASAPSYLNTFGSLAPGAVAPWMSPYIEQALQPQIQDIQRQSALTAKGINAGATGAGAFGDARLGIQQGENDRNTGQLIANTVGAGYQNAYDRAVAAAQGAFGANAGQFNTELSARNAAIGENAQINQGNNAAGLAAFAQNAGQFNSEDAAQRAAIAENAQITQGNNQAGLAAWGANTGQFNSDLARQLSAAGQLPSIVAGGYGVQQQQAEDLLSAGKVQQDQLQQGLSTAYQDFINQAQYPQELLNLRLATQQGSPYNTTRLTQTPYSPTAQNIGALASVFGFLGRPAGGSGG